MEELLCSRAFSCSSGYLCDLLAILVDLRRVVGPSGGLSQGFNSPLCVFLPSSLGGRSSIDQFVAVSSVVASFISASVVIFHSHRYGFFPSLCMVNVSSPCWAWDVGFSTLSTLDGVPSSSAYILIAAACRWSAGTMNPFCTPRHLYCHDQDICRRLGESMS